jgi:AAA domain
VDCIAYLEHHNISPPPELIEYAEELPLKAVFVLDTIKPFKKRSKSGRESNYTESMRIRDRLLNVYTRMGFSPRFVEVSSIAARIREI